MGVRFVAYDEEGRVIMTGHASNASLALRQTGKGTPLVGEGEPETHYVDLSGEPTIVEKTEFANFDKTEIEGDGIDIASVVIPIGTSVSVDGTLVGVSEDALFEFTASDAGSFVISLAHVSRIPKEVTINAI